MRVQDFTYSLPPERIAQHPPEERGTTRLLTLNRQTGVISHEHYSDLINHVEAGDLVVLNDTKVIKARLQVQNDRGQDRELLLLESHGADIDTHSHRALYHGKLHQGEKLSLHGETVTVKRLEQGGIAVIHSTTDLFKLAQEYGTVPLPPYMKRQATPEDTKRYQTEFAAHAGSVAAPTASLNFTNELMTKLEAKAVRVVRMTLHVGLGTFLPIRTDDVEGHTMHQEYFEIPREVVVAIQETKQSAHKVIAVGTTVTRALEYAATDILKQPATAVHGEADIFIYPGYSFQLVDAMVTNFHAPKSTVLMMAAAFAGWDHLKHAYEEAISHNYQFLSYGDSMFMY